MILVYEFESVSYGIHVCNRIWQPIQAQEPCLSKQYSSPHEYYAVSVRNVNNMVGHVPIQMCRAVWHFLSHGLTFSINEMLISSGCTLVSLCQS